MNEILLTAIGVGGSTIIGSLLGYFIKNVSHAVNDTIVGLCAGVMLSAAVLGLLVPAFELTPTWSSVWLPCLGVVLGVLLLNVLDIVTPHLHTITGVDLEQHQHNQHLNRVLLFVMAIALHKFPEGMAAGVGFGGESTHDAVNVAIAISLQNVPEGMVIISPLLLAGVSHLRTFVIALVIGLLEVLGVFTGYYLGGLSAAVLPLMLALSGGAMLYVVSDEMIPESHAHGYQKPATYALLVGFVLILLLERL
ncbi:MAG: ZIP family metal transporter [Bacteroidaceae bacterium]|nr:ZIP family metal transporter [Bacteroidaceae bacterium]